MTITDQKTIVKRIAKAWNSERKSISNIDNDYLMSVYQKDMLAFRYALEMCGLTLNEIIALGNADDLEKAIDELFNSQTLK